MDIRYPARYSAAGNGLKGRISVGRFFEELKQRNVFRVAAAYAIVGWLLMQIASILFDTYPSNADAKFRSLQIDTPISEVSLKEALRKADQICTRHLSPQAELANHVCRMRDVVSDARNLTRRNPHEMQLTE